MSVEWINPIALAGLAAAVGPIVVHLLRRQRATRVPFPTIRFLATSRAAATRFRRPADPLLLAVRVAIIATAAIAAAQPIVITASRRASERQRHRALVIDSSQSMAPATSQVAEAVAAERQRSAETTEIRTTTLADGLKQASAALHAVARGATAEIVVISDFQKGSLDAGSVASIPSEIGLRFVAIDPPRPSGSFVGLRTFSAEALAAEQHITLDGPRTRVALTLAPSGRRPVMLLRPEDRGAVAPLMRAVAAAGAPALPPDRGLVVIFPGAHVPMVEAPRAPWMIEALIVARADERLRVASIGHRAGVDPRLPPAWQPVVRAPSGHPLVAVAAAQQDLAVYVAAPPASLLGAAALRSMLFAVAPLPLWDEREVERIDASQLGSWTRPPGPVSSGRQSGVAPGDARWIWSIVLVLLGVETAVRRTRAQSFEEGRRAA